MKITKICYLARLSFSVRTKEVRKFRKFNEVTARMKVVFWYGILAGVRGVKVASENAIALNDIGMHY